MHKLRAKATGSSFIIIMLVLLTALHLTFSQFYRTNMLKEERVSLDNYVEGTVHRPFAYRVLVPILLRSLDAVTPSSIDRALDSLGLRMTSWRPLNPGAPPLPVELRIRSGPENKHPRMLIWLAAIQFISLLGFAHASAKIYETVFPSGPALQYASIAALVTVAAVVSRGFGHIYDFPTIALLAYLYWFMLAQYHWAYLALFALACLNKETTILVAISWAAVYFGRMPLGRFIQMLALQIVIFLTIYGSLRFYFHHSPGSPTEFHLAQQLSYYLMQAPAFHITTLMILFLISFRWSEKPEILRWASLSLIPHLLLYLIFANPGETRNWYEALPLLNAFFLYNGAIIASQWPSSTPLKFALDPHTQRGRSKNST